MSCPFLFRDPVTPFCCVTLGRASIRHPPQRTIKIGIETEARQRHAAVFYLDALGLETLALLLEPSASRRKRNLPTGPQHAKPWQLHAVRNLTQRPADQPRPAREARAGGDGAVAGDAAARNGCDGSEDARMGLGFWFFHDLQQALYTGSWHSSEPGSTCQGDRTMRHFEAVRSHVGSLHELRHNDPYLISFDLTLPQERHQGIYLAELEDESGRRYLRISTPVGPLAGADPRRCLRFNWEQRKGFLAVADLDGSPYLHLCENRPYELLDAVELKRLIEELGELGDQLERIVAAGGDDL